MQGADAFAARGITGHIQTAPKGDGFRRIEDLIEAPLVDVAQNGVKEAGTHAAIGFDDC
jgi:uncharacterized protein YunC (DUF1805 family)